MTTPTTSEPQLAPPGAGLPKLELIFARLIFAWKRMRGDAQSFDDSFRREREAILALVRSCSEEEAGQRVLIPRLAGLEDSSRFWSVWMTLDHLRITNLGFARAIGALRKGVVPDRVASTAAVKPNPEAGAHVLGAFEKSCEGFLAATKGATRPLPGVRYAHPWFGRLDESGWHAVGGFHMALHRKQIERILAGMAGR